LKQFQTHFKAKHEKGVGTEFPHVLALALNPCLTPHWNKSVLQLEITQCPTTCQTNRILCSDWR